MNTVRVVERWCELIQGSGYRLTAPRRAIVEIMATIDRALGTLEEYDLGR